MKRRRMTSWLVTLAVLVVALAFLVRLVEPRLAFFPFKGETETPKDHGLAYEPLMLTTSDGERLAAWMIPAAQPRAVVVYFHGNGGNLSNWAPILAEIVRHGHSVLAVDYRGYGLSSGRPSERGVYRDVAATLAHARRLTRDAPLVYWGRSLGATMAAYAASIEAPDGVILEASFPSARAAVRSSPVLAGLSLLGSYRFPTAEFMKNVRAPALVLHGDSDGVIPFELGREVYDALPGPKQFLVIRGGDHNDGFPADAAYWPAVERFIAGLQRSRLPL
jgi:fermentation-respiration switch protein FrsA (DUF1100 family)